MFSKCPRGLIGLEQSRPKGKVGGSSPPGGTNEGPWYRGNTRLWHSRVRGSIPRGSTTLGGLAERQCAGFENQ